ncbi:MAG: BamA/TamA family outer membrane protein [Saprospiraceae bacterium]|nr:BamA/TamA family outer membrane protein [Saprospiraceae bacterium]
MPLLRIFMMFAVVLLLHGAIHSQVEEPQSIVSIEFENNQKNTEAHLLRALPFVIGDQVDHRALQKNAQALQNLSSIGGVVATVDTIDAGLRISYLVDEDPTLFPIVGLGGIEDNFWWQLGFTDFNFQGRGDVLTLFYQNIDRRHNGSLEYRKSYFGKSNWGASFNIRRYASVEPFNFQDFGRQVFYEYTNTSVSLSGIYNIDPRQLFEFGTTYFQEDYRKDARHVMEDTPGPLTREEPKLLIKALHQIDRIDYSYLLLDGFANQLILQSVVNLQYNSLFHMVLNNLTFFKKMPGKGNLASRMRLGFSTNEVSPFAPFVLDSYVNIRGVGNRIDRGTAAVVLNLEYRQRLFETGLLGVQLVAFSDAGTWRNPGGPLSDLTDSANFQHFIGAGLRLILKKAHNASLRLDYGFSARSTNDDHGFVFGIGQYF